MDIITGIHSISEALKNPLRTDKTLYATEDSLKETEKYLQKSLKKDESIDIVMLAPHALQQKAEVVFKEFGFNYQRVPSNLFLLANEIERKDLTWLYDKVIDGKVTKIVALDQVSDVHNGAAIMRTAAFYGVDVIMLSSKGAFGSAPSFFRISSGAAEYVKLVSVSSLPKALGKLQKMGVECIGLSEHSSDSLKTDEKVSSRKAPATCLVLGAEDVGVSHAVSRQLEKLMSIDSYGPIKSLNVSVASAIAMERVFRKS